MMLDLDNIFYQISLSILLTFCPIVYEYYREKLHVNHFWELKSEPFNSFHPNIRNYGQLADGPTRRRRRQLADV